MLWEGSIEKVTTFDIVLSADEVAYLYNVGPDVSSLGSDGGGTGINKNKLTNISAYYNANASAIILDELTNVGNIQLMNSNGQLVRSYNSNETTLDVSGLSNGIYILCIADQDGVTSRKKISIY